MVMEIIIIAILAEISIFFELLAIFIRANVDDFAGWVGSLLKAERAVRQVVLVLPVDLLLLPVDLLELEEPLHSILLF